MVGKGKISDVMQPIVHILAHKLWNMVIEAVICKGNMITSVFYESVGSIGLTMAA